MEVGPQMASVPADLVLLRGNVVVDESSLTGEPMPVHLRGETKGSKN